MKLWELAIDCLSVSVDRYEELTIPWSILSCRSLVGDKIGIGEVKLYRIHHRTVFIFIQHFFMVLHADGRITPLIPILLQF